jgi:hypothetical protein
LKNKKAINQINQFKFQPVNTAVEFVTIAGESAIRVVKKDKLMQFDENTYAKLQNVNFHNGVIEVKVLSRLLPDAPDFARGFIGLAFRINDDDSAFESFYVRPTNGRSTDPVRKNHALQYFAYPQYTFSYFRDHGINDYEGTADIGLNEWIDIKVLVKDDRAEFFVNENKDPVLTVEPMKHGAHSTGSIGLFVDVGTEGYFKDLIVTPFDEMV